MDLVECVDGFKVGVSAIRHHDAEDGRQERIKTRELVRLAHLSNIVGNYYEVPRFRVSAEEEAGFAAACLSRSSCEDLKTESSLTRLLMSYDESH